MLLLGVVACSDKNDELNSQQTELRSPNDGLPTIPGGTLGVWPPQNFCAGCAVTSPRWAMCRIDHLWQKVCTQAIDMTPEEPQPILYLAQYNPDTAYAKDFRNNYLAAFEKGVKYIEYYEQIGQAMFDYGGIPILDIPAHYSFAMATYAAADSMRYGHPNCIPFTAQYKIDALAMIAYWRARCSQPLFQQSMDSITADLNTHTGLTRAQIYALY